MKNIILIILVGILGLSATQAQIKWGEYSHSFLNNREEPSAVGLIVALKKENNSFWEIRQRSKHFDTLQHNQDFLRHRPKEMISRTVFDTGCAQFFFKGVDPYNAYKYQYRITEFPGNKVLIPWKSIHSFTDSVQIRDSGLPKMAYLGGYRTTWGLC